MSLNASREYSEEISLRLLVTAVSMACESASMPVSAVTRRGCVTVSAGSSTATAGAALGSPHAIFWCVAASAMRANDWHSLPVPAVVGTAIIGSIGFVALPTPQ